ncbi:MAG: serpin family protein, partial [Bacteroidota bacterium]
MRISSLVVLLALLLSGCDTLGGSDTPTDPARIDLSDSGEALVRSGNAFGTSLYARVSADTTANLMLSPLSASVALTMLLNGADGETAAQIQQALGYPAGWDLAQINADY